MNYSESQLKIALKRWEFETSNQQFIASDFHDNMWVCNSLQDWFEL